MYNLSVDRSTDARQAGTMSPSSILSPQVSESCCVRSNVGIVCEMEADTEHSSARFKPRAVIEFLAAEGVTADET